MKSAQVLILDKDQISKKINRIAWQIFEDNLDEKELVIAGIRDGGYKLAQRLQKVLQEIAHFNLLLLRINIENKKPAALQTTGIDNDQLKNKVIILVDDVLNSGKTLAYGFGVFLNTPHKKIRTVVLIDRSHKIFPIATDFVGLQLATVLKEHVDVVIDTPGEEDRVYLS